MRSLLRRLVLLTVALLAVMTLAAPAAHANHLDGFGFRRCGFFQPVFVIPTSRGNIVVLRDACGFERERFEPFRRRFFFNDFNDFDDFDNGGTSNTIIINGPLI